MIPILYDKNETSFTHNGIGLLTETTKAIVTEERNGSFELSLQYPITGRFYSEITDGAVIKVKANETSEPQLFRIYKSSKPLNGMVTYSAEHISYDLNGIPLLGFSARNTTPQTAIMRAIEESALLCDFSAWSDIDTLNSTTISDPCSIRALLGGRDGSILDTWGGEYEFDNFTIKLHTHRGADKGVVIEYGKNLKDLKQESNISECYTHLMPYASYTLENENGGTSEIVYVYLKEKIIPLTKAENIGHNKAHIMDFSDRFGENEDFTEEKLRAKAAAYAESANLGIPKVNITVSFVQLWQTEEYKNIAPLERVRLCDTVTVRFSKLGVDAKAKVIKTVYNSLEEKYDSITIGDAKSSFADTVNNQTSAIKNIKTSISEGQAKAAEELKRAVENATNLITGHSGGYVVLNPAKNPQEILILDQPTIEEAVNVWRWNSGGLGHSSTGYNGKFTTAITADGSIVADFITTGVFNGALIKADSIQTAAISSEYKKSVTDEISTVTKTISQSFKAADEKLLSEITETLKSYSTTTQVSSSIKQTSDNIMAEVNKKVNNADFGTKITQNYSSVRVAWNNISKYIEFSDGALNIYQSTSQGHENLLMQMKNDGAWYYHNGTTVGKIGTNHWSGDESYRGLVFDLEHNADYMSWEYRSSEDIGTYTAYMIFHANDKAKDKGYDGKGLYLGGGDFGVYFRGETYFKNTTWCGNNLRISGDVKIERFTDGSGGFYSNGNSDIVLKNNDTVFKLLSGCTAECYANLDMKNWSILNQSDERYKKNIAPTEINALSLISQIEMKSYDWIETGEHCDIGVIAQQLREVIPELVHEDKKTGNLSIKTDKFIPYLIKAIQELCEKDTNREEVYNG